MQGRTVHAKTEREVEQGATLPGETHDDETDIVHLHHLFGLPQDRLRLFPGASSYCRHLEQSFAPLLSDAYDALWTATGKPKPGDPRDCWQFFHSVCSAIRKVKDESSSIEDVWSLLCSSPSNIHLAAPEQVDSKEPGVVAVFSTLCWITSTLQPKLRWEEFNGSPSLMVRRQFLEEGLRIETARRPISSIFRQFRGTMPSSRWRAPIGEPIRASTVLELSCLNYASLHQIGKIGLNWVDDLTSHLDFDASTRRLSIFRFPSICALFTLTEQQNLSIPVVTGLNRALYALDHDDAIETLGRAQLYQEVLMSYRLLFGQERGSRRLVRAALNLHRKERAEDYDKLLDQVCAQEIGRKIHRLPSALWPTTCCSFDGRLQEESSYSAQDDFPLFGARLAKLQEFTLRQQPSRLRDLWLDRRNPLQWYTFWAVLIVGGMSILLALLQLLVSIAQLVTSILLPCNC